MVIRNCLGSLGSAKVGSSQQLCILLVQVLDGSQVFDGLLHHLHIVHSITSSILLDRLEVHQAKAHTAEYSLKMALPCWQISFHPGEGNAQHILLFQANPIIRQQPHQVVKRKAGELLASSHFFKMLQCEFRRWNI